MKNLIKVLTITILLSIGIVVYGENGDSYKRGLASNIKDLKIISEIMDQIFDVHVNVNEEEYSKKELIEGALKGMVGALDDPYSEYYTAEEFQEFQEDISGKYTGVGMVIEKERDKYLVVVSPIEDTPAYNAGIKSKDKIISIDGKSTLPLSSNECVSMLKGEAGTKLKVTIIRGEDGEPQEIELARAEIELKYVKHEMLEDKLGYLRLTQFSENVSKDIRKSLESLQKEGMEGLIFDLRDNPGGDLSQAIEISSIFIKDGIIVSVKDKQKNEEVYKRIGKYLGDFPMVILVNEGSASASEIVAGAARDHKRGILVGETTFGKGLVQSIVGVPPTGGALKLTTAEYYTPSGISIHKEGIKPDILVSEEDDYLFNSGKITNIDEESSKENKEERIKEIKKEEAEELLNKEDEQLKAAISVLKGLIDKS